MGRDPRSRKVEVVTQRALGLGVVGLGMAGAVMVRAAARHPGVVLAAAADPQAAPREAFGRDFNARTRSNKMSISARSRTDVGSSSRMTRWPAA